MFSNLSLRWKLLAPVTILVILMAIQVFTGIQGARATHQIAEHLGSRLLSAGSLLLEADRDLYQVLVAERTLVSVDGSDSGRDKLFKQIADNRSQSATRLDKFAAIAADTPTLADGTEALVASYRQHRQAWEQTIEQIVTLLRKGDEEARQGAKALSLGEGSVRFETMRDDIDKLTEVVSEEAKRAEAGAVGVAEKSYVVALSLGLLAVLMALVTFVVLPRTVVRPIDALTRRLDEIAEGGADLSRRLPEDRRDEIGMLAASFNRFQLSLGRLFSELRGNAEQLAQGVEQLESRIRDVADQAESLADLSTANAASVEQITVSVSHIADNGSETESLARETGTLTRSAAGEIERISAHADDSAKRVRELAEVLAGLDQRSESINGIVGAIREIADQTNLLALNAAIEAARAGEQGRGFAVVADEVRKLAERTGGATLEISSMLSGMRNETQQAMDFMRVTEQTVQSSVALTGEARSKVAEIEAQVTEVAQRMTDVAASINEQRSATASMSQSTETITRQLQQADEALRQASQTTRELARIAAGTREQFARFRD
ncbi:MAG: methyl-accepting chemotaxis protein [Rhodocyclaceae bacterium]|nr:methyl-accepting chemotaxis protein [Rhodocyclaceae bacterium]